jgi:hypothetical protein
MVRDAYTSSHGGPRVSCDLVAAIGYMRRPSCSVRDGRPAQRSCRDGFNETPDAGGVAPAMSFVRKSLGADDREAVAKTLERSSEPLPTPHVEPAPSTAPFLRVARLRPAP